MAVRSSTVTTEEVARKFHRLLDLDRNSPEFEPLFEEVDRLLAVCVRAEADADDEGRRAYASHAESVY